MNSYGGTSWYFLRSDENSRIRSACSHVLHSSDSMALIDTVCSYSEGSLTSIHTYREIQNHHSGEQMLKAVVVLRVWRLHMTAHKAGVKCRLFCQASPWYAITRNILMQELQHFVVLFIVNLSSPHAMIWQYILTEDTYTWWHTYFIAG